MTNHSPPLNQQLLANIRELLNQVFTAVNTTMVQTYWQIGRSPYLSSIENEQQCEAQAEHAKHVLKQRPESLTKEFGRGFNLTTLRKMCVFYPCFPIRDALRTELSGTHYRTLDWQSRSSHADF